MQATARHRVQEEACWRRFFAGRGASLITQSVNTRASLSVSCLARCQRTVTLRRSLTTQSGPRTRVANS